MSDKMLMEDWRKYLSEEDLSEISKREQKWKDIADAKGVWARYVEPNKTHIDGKCISLKDEIGRIEQLQKDEEVPELARKTAEAIMSRWKEGILDFGLVSLVAAGHIMGAAAAGLLSMFGVGIWKGLKKWRQRKPTPEEIEKFPMATLLHMGSEFQNTLNPKLIDQIDEEYVEYLKGLLSKGKVCLSDPAVLSINEWIQSDEGYGLCKKASEYTKSELLPGEGGRDYGENPLTPEERAEEDKELAAYKARQNESKFHDDWRNFLLTEEKL